MRLARWLIPAAILGILLWVGGIYVKRKASLGRDVPTAPKPLGRDTDGRANDWVWVKSEGNRPVVEMHAKSFRQVKEPSVMELDGVELRLFHKDASQFDLVRTEKAQSTSPGKHCSRMATLKSPWAFRWTDRSMGGFSRFIRRGFISRATAARR